MIRNEIENEYLEWLYNLVCRQNFHEQISYRKLLSFLHNTEFVYTMARDGNRADDGIDLRYQFAYEYAEIDNAELYLDGPCSMLEMMIALAIRCEETIMDDPSKGDRTKQWFWGMITNLGLGSMMDDRFDEQYADDVITRFLNHEYEPDGTGGLFKVRHCKYDLRKVEIWFQLCWYLDSIS